jgi:hypothetical protein
MFFNTCLIRRIRPYPENKNTRRIGGFIGFHTAAHAIYIGIWQSSAFSSRMASIMQQRV